ncbi:MAG TPA: nuclear transport factor 2 family protein [Solirubrobacteraceae bacterium]|nr:nuclear transport factor 2 family protein [Solirubrobacteraceae bacterium]
MDRTDLARWIEGYERAWRTAGTDGLGRLFAPQATYRAGPFEPTVTGLDAIAGFWEAEREGPDEPFTLTWEPVAVECDVGVARVEVAYERPPAALYRDLWIITLNADGRCRAFEEWPFFPGQPLSAAEAG